MMNFDPSLYHYPSRRAVIYGNKGMVATSTPQAAQAGIAMLRKGGNAVDAAIATAACLTVVEPGTNGIGSDAFALVWIKDKLHGLNASGTAPVTLSAEKIRAMGYEEMPKLGWLPVTVPGAPAAWAELSDRFGKLPFEELLAPAIEYAREGFPVGESLGSGWKRAWKNYSKEFKEDYLNHWFEHFSVEGRCPEIGDIWRNEHTARTLELIAETKAESFYRGVLAEKMVAFAQKTGGYFTMADFESYRPFWVDPIQTNYRGYDVWEIPPNGHGISVLMALNILKGFDMGSHREDARNYHLQIEAMKLAYTDAKKYVTDKDHMSVTIEQLLSQAYADERRKLIGHNAMDPVPGMPAKGGTVYLATADKDGNMVSFIQSNYNGFGSGVVVPETGISLQNRGNNFSLEEGHDNLYVGGKRPYHTIIPGFLSKDGVPIGPFGVMGGFMQPQGHVQMVCNTVDFHMNPQDSLSAPRWQWMGEKNITVEHQVPSHIIQLLRGRGHEMKVVDEIHLMGRGQIIWRMPNGVYCGGTEPRTDGMVAVY